MIGTRTKGICENADYAIDRNRCRAMADRSEYVDFLMEMKLSKPRRNRDEDVSSRGVIMDDGEIYDDDYIAFLLDLEEFVKVEDESDPDYVMFLENLEECGSSYKLKKSIKHGVSLPIVYETENVHLDKEPRRKNPQHERGGYNHKERNIAEKNNGRKKKSCAFDGTQKERTWGESMKRRRSCSPSSAYFHEARNYGEKKFTINVTSHEVYSTLERTRRETIQQHYCSTTSSHLRGESMKMKKTTSPSKTCIQKGISVGEKRNGRSMRSYGVYSTLKDITRGGSMKWKKSCFSSDVYVLEERNVGEENYRRNVRLCGFNGKEKKRTHGDSTKRKKSCSASDDYVQEVRNVGKITNRRTVRSRKVNGKRKERTLGESFNNIIPPGPQDFPQIVRSRGDSRKRETSCSPSDCYVEVRTSDSSDDAISELKDLGIYDRMVESLIEDVQEKRTVCEVIKRRKLLSDPSNYIQEERNSNVKDGPESQKMITKSHRSECFQDAKRIEKKNPNSLTFEKSLVVIDDSTPAPKNSNLWETDSAAFDYFQGEKSLVVIDHLTSVPNNLDLQETGSLNVEYIQRGKGLVVIDHSTSAPNSSNVQETDSLNVDCFRGEKSLVLFDHSTLAPKDSSLQKSVVNDTYNLFLENLKTDGESCFYVDGNNVPVYYESTGDRQLTIVPESSNLPNSSIPAESSYQPICVVSESNNTPISIAGKSSDQPKLKVAVKLPSKAASCDARLPPLPSTIGVAIQRQPTHPRKSLIPASRPTMPTLDKQNHSKDSHRVPPNMRNKLLVILSRPYSEEEHNRLWKVLSFRSPVHIHRDSRSGGSDRPGKMGLSLLDWNPDLESEINKVKSDPHKVLNLLRMLEFYVKKLPVGRVFKPWMDDSMMAISPGSGSA